MGSKRPRKSNNAPSRRRAIESPRRKPAPPKQSSKLRKAADARADADRICVTIGALRHIQDKLEIVRSAATCVAHALMEQVAEVDNDAAIVLKHHVADGITDQMIRIGCLMHYEYNGGEV